MKRIATALFTLSVVLMTTTGSVNASPSVEVTRNLTSMPLAFTENQGQWDEKVSFRANAGGATMWFASDGAYYQFTRTIESNPISVVDKRYGMPDDLTLSGVEGLHRQPDSVETMMIKANFVGANTNPQMVGVDMIEYKCNYFIGNDPNEWHTDVPNYSAIVYEEIYTGIDLKYYSNGEQMEYDFIVVPGADFSQIAIQYESAESVTTNENGELVVETQWGVVVEQRPVIYQVEEGSRIAVAGEYRLESDNTFGFSLGDSYNPTLPLVIDPVLSYGTYLGGGDSDEGWSIAVDTDGCAYVTGKTYSSDFPIHTPYQASPQGGHYDAFVTKLSSVGSSLIYSTYFGGGDFDEGFGVAVDNADCAYVTGWTGSSDFPSEKPYQSYHGTFDAFVAKFSSSGNSLVYSTCLGGTNLDKGYGIAVDAAGCAYVTGHTYSTDFPTTTNAYQADHVGIMEDVFVTKLSSSGGSLVYSTFLGGGYGDWGVDIALDNAGCAYVTGYTSSSDFPTENAYQPNNAGMGHTDAFVTKINSTGSSLVYSTYLGGKVGDWALDIAADTAGCAYVTGQTWSSDFPTENPYQAVLPGVSYGYSGAFVAKLSSNGGTLVYSTYLGGWSNAGYGIAVDDAGCAYVTGATLSMDFPIENPFQGDCGGHFDAFVTKFSASGGSLIYSTFLGGVSNDDGYGIALDNDGSAYVTGYTGTNFPTENPYQENYGGGGDAFVAKLSLGDPTAAVEFDPDNLPTHYNMSQSYPNPFNPTTTIEFNLPKRSHVTVKIYNLLGQQVQSLVDQELSVGNYKVTWDGSTFGGGHASTGVYFYRIVTEDFIETKKMVLLK